MSTTETVTYWKTETGEPILYSETWSQCDHCPEAEHHPEFGEGLWVLVARSAKVPPYATRCTKEEYSDLVEALKNLYLEGVAERTKEMVAKHNETTNLEEAP